MSPESVLELVQHAAVMTVWLSLPAAACAALLGLLLGIAQAVTSIQDQSLPQSIKIVAVLLVVLATGGWAGAELYAFGDEAFRSFPGMLR